MHLMNPSVGTCISIAKIRMKGDDSMLTEHARPSPEQAVKVAPQARPFSACAVFSASGLVGPEQSYNGEGRRSKQSEHDA